MRRALACLPWHEAVNLGAVPGLAKRCLVRPNKDNNCSIEISWRQGQQRHTFHFSSKRQKSALWLLHDPLGYIGYAAQSISNQLQYRSGTLSVPSGSSSPSKNTHTSWLQLRSRPWAAAAWHARMVSAADASPGGGHSTCSKRSPDSMVSLAWKRSWEISVKLQVATKVGGTSRIATFRASSKAAVWRRGGIPGSSARTE